MLAGAAEPEAIVLADPGGKLSAPKAVETAGVTGEGDTSMIVPIRLSFSANRSCSSS